MLIVYRKKQPDGTWLEVEANVADERMDEVIDKAFQTFCAGLPELPDINEIRARRLAREQKKGKR